YNVQSVGSSRASGRLSSRRGNCRADAAVPLTQLRLSSLRSAQACATLSPAGRGRGEGAIKELARSGLSASIGGDGHVSPRTWLGFLAMCLGMFMAVLDIQIVASSLPEIQAAVGIPSHELSWVQTAYLIAEVIAIPLTGWLTRLMTLRGMFVIAAGGFTAASVGCAMSNSFATLVTFRVVQGFCGGAIIPAVFTSVFMLFPKHRQVRATPGARGVPGPGPPPRPRGRGGQPRSPPRGVRLPLTPAPRGRGS